MTRVIKAGPEERVIPAEVHDARMRAAEILAGAEAALAQARRDGYDAGRQEGLASTTELLTRAAAAADARAAAAEPELRKLAVKIAEKIIGRELALAPGAIVDIVRGALELAAARKHITVRVHPDDAPAVRTARPELTVRADPAVARGGCLVDTEVGTIDARLDVQLAALEKALLA